MSDICPICLEGDVDCVKEWQITVCCHKFHKECLANLPKDQRRCPLCRTELEAHVEYEPQLQWHSTRGMSFIPDTRSELSFFRATYRRHTNFGTPAEQTEYIPQSERREYVGIVRGERDDEYRNITSYPHDDPIPRDFQYDPPTRPAVENRQYSGSANFSRIADPELRLLIDTNGVAHAI